MSSPSLSPRGHNLSAACRRQFSFSFAAAKILSYETTFAGASENVFRMLHLDSDTGGCEMVNYMWTELVMEFLISAVWQICAGHGRLLLLC